MPIDLLGPCCMQQKGVFVSLGRKPRHLPRPERTEIPVRAWCWLERGTHERRPAQNVRHLTPTVACDASSSDGASLSYTALSPALSSESCPRLQHRPARPPRGQVAQLLKSRIRRAACPQVYPRHLIPRRALPPQPRKEPLGRKAPPQQSHHSPPNQQRQWRVQPWF